MGQKRIPIADYIGGRLGTRRKARAPTRSHTPGVMNKLERAYADRLELMKADGSIHDFWFEPMRIVLAHKTDAARSKTICPDFLVQALDGTLEFHDTKPTKKDGRPYVTEDAHEKMRWLATTYPFDVFYVYRKKAEGWIKERVA